MIRILGIDPGSISTGFGIIEHQKNNFKYITSGCIKPLVEPIPHRLQIIFDDLSHIIKTYKPNICGIEDVFVHLNPRGSIKLGQARGVAILACVKFNLEIYEYSPRQIKQAVVGYGNAEKAQMQAMIKIMLNLSATPQADAADALGAAICVANMQNKLVLR